MLSVRSLLDLSGKVAIVTGGSRGIGLQMAEGLGEMGARVAVTARKQGELDEARAHLEGMGIECLTVAGDLAASASIPGIVDAVMAPRAGVLQEIPDLSAVDMARHAHMGTQLRVQARYAIPARAEQRIHDRSEPRNRVRERLLAGSGARGF